MIAEVGVVDTDVEAHEEEAILGVGQAALLKKVQSKFAGVGASMKQALDVKLSFKDGSAKLDIKLSKKSSIDVGGDIKLGKLKVAMENLSEIVKIPTVSL